MEQTNENAERSKRRDLWILFLFSKMHERTDGAVEIYTAVWELCLERKCFILSD